MGSDTVTYACRLWSTTRSLHYLVPTPLAMIHSWLMMASWPSIAYADRKTPAACRQADSALFLRVSNTSCRSSKRGSRSFYQRRGRRRRNAGPQPRRARSRPTKGKAVIPVLLLDSG